MFNAWLLTGLWCDAQTTMIDNASNKGHGTMASMIQYAALQAYGQPS